MNIFKSIVKKIKESAEKIVEKIEDSEVGTQQEHMPWTQDDNDYWTSM